LSPRLNDLGRPIAVSILAVALLNAASELTRPDRRHLPTWVIATALALMLMHAALYWFGENFRGRFGLLTYVRVQGGLVLACGLSGPPMGVVACLYIVLMVDVIRLAPARWGTAMITAGTILLFAVNAMIAFDLYQGATAGLLLAIAGAIAHAVVALRRPAPVPSPVFSGDGLLTPRELEVLVSLANGARNGEVAASLRITERTVKAHLSSIYQKLGVDSRTGAVAAARRRGVIR
jgi:DNA-binding CsgD family transcriptional regulator